MWLDGFRTEDGKVRQFYFTEEMAKSIPELMIGKDDTVPAFGFCFYAPKETPVYEGGRRMSGKMSKDFFTLRSGDAKGWGSGRLGTDMMRGGEYKSFTSSGSPITGHSVHMDYDYASAVYLNSSLSTPTSSMHLDLSEKKCKFSTDEVKAYNMNADSLDGGVLYRATLDSAPMAASFSADADSLIEPERCTRLTNAEVGVGAGAEISQSIQDDRREMSDWQDKPSATMRIYFVFQEEFERYAEAGLNALKGEKEGFLSGLPVGVAHE
jgi:hypothetical protein